MRALQLAALTPLSRVAVMAFPDNAIGLNNVAFVLLISIGVLCGKYLLVLSFQMISFAVLEVEYLELVEILLSCFEEDIYRKFLMFTVTECCKGV